jgi:translation elongation factor EF-1alpha
VSNESMAKAADSNPREVFDDFADVVARLSESEAILGAELQHLAFRTSQVSDRLTIQDCPGWQSFVGMRTHPLSQRQLRITTF